MMIYLASPYSHPDPRVRQWRFEQACQATARLLRGGLLVFSPIAHSHPLTRFGMPTGWDFWQPIDRAYMTRCEVVAVLTLPGWRDSVGVQAEMELARELDLPVVYVVPGDDPENVDLPTLAELLGQRPSVDGRSEAASADKAA